MTPYLFGRVMCGILIVTSSELTAVKRPSSAIFRILYFLFLVEYLSHRIQEHIPIFYEFYFQLKQVQEVMFTYFLCFFPKQSDCFETL